MKRNVVKPILFLTTIILALLVGISVKGTSISNKDDLLSLNIEALSDGEIYEIHFVKITQTTVIYTYDII